jgi:hypothetical protein
MTTFKGVFLLLLNVAFDFSQLLNVFFALKFQRPRLCICQRPWGPSFQNMVEKPEYIHVSFW